MTRREFALRLFALVAAAYPAQARGWGVLSSITGSRGGPKRQWKDWDEASESTLDLDQDGDGTEDTFVCLMKETVVGSNETGQGVLTGADLVLTQAGAVAGAVDGTRVLDGVNDSFNWTATGIDAFTLNRSQFTLIWKLKDLQNGGFGLLNVFSFLDAGANEYLILDTNGAGNIMRAYVRCNTGWVWNTVLFGETYPTSGDLWIYVDRDGGTYRMGWHSQRVNSWNGIPAARKLIATGAALHTNSFATRKSPWCDPVGGNGVPCKAAYFLASRKLLLRW